MDKLKKTLSSLSPDHQSQMQSKNSSEEKKILLQQQMDPMGSSRKDEVVVKIDGLDVPKEADLVKGSSPTNPVWRDSSYDFSKDTVKDRYFTSWVLYSFVFGLLSDNLNVPKVADPVQGSSPSNPVWRDSSYDFSKDTFKEFEFGGSPESTSSLPKILEMQSPSYGQMTPRETKVSFNESIPEPSRPVQRRSNGEEEVLVCSGNNSFRRRSSLLRTKTKSRLMDPSPERGRKSQAQAPFKSGALGRASEIDEDDPFLDGDLPKEYRKEKFSTLSLLQLLSLILIIAALTCTLVFKRFRRKRVFQLELWKWEVMVLALISGRLVSGWVIRIIVFFIERNFLLRKRVLYFVYGVKNAVQNCIWLALVLITWQLIFDKRVEEATKGKVLPHVTRIWICLLLGTLIWLVKTILVKVLASSFHVSTFFDRIQESLFNQYVIETLSGPPLIEIQRDQEEEERVTAEVEKLQSAGISVPDDLKANVLGGGRVIGSGRHEKSPRSSKTPRFSSAMPEKMEEGITIDHLHRLNQKNISAWNMKRLMNVVRNGVFSTLDEQIQNSTGEDESAVQITSEVQAKAAAKKIFYNVAKPQSKYIHVEDIMRFLREDEAVKTIRLFEGASECKGISKAALKNWVVDVFRERRALALSLNDTKTAVKKLHQMINVAMGIVILVIWSLVLKIATTHFFVFLGSQLLLVAFMFGNTCKTTFEAIIFLFVMHPYDVGDRCEIDGVQMVVEEMNILTTIFLRFDNQKIIYPNSVLATKPISNYYRSPDMGDAIDFCIHVATPLDKVTLMKGRITKYCNTKEDHWYPDPMIVLRDVEDMNRLKISVWLSHRMNHQNMGERWTRRALLVEEMIKAFRDLDIEYRMLPLDVNVRNMPGISSSRLPSTWTTLAS